MADNCSRLESCLACGGTDLRPVLDLGMVPLADFPLPGEEVVRAPLRLLQCARCELVQLGERVDPARLYSHYYYTSGLNESMARALRDVVREVEELVDLERGDTVVDVGANDGTLLKAYSPRVLRYGFDPADVAARAVRREGGWVHYPEFFPPRGPWTSYVARPPKAITACAMFYDLAEPRAFLEAVKAWLHPDGLFVAQMPDLATMLEQNALDNVCHEHLAYWPTETLLQLALSVGLQCVGMSHNNVNGGSVRYLFRHCTPRAARWGSRSLGRHAARTGPVELAHFATRVADNASATVLLVEELRASGQNVWAYGASTKFGTLAHYYGLGPDLITAVADRNPEKWGRTTCTGIPIVSEEEMRRAKPDYLFVGPWGFKDAFLQREATWLAEGGRFIFPLPELAVIGGGVDARVLQAVAATTARD